MTPNPLDGPFMTSTRITDSSGMPGYAITPDPAGTPSRARELREAAMSVAELRNRIASLPDDQPVTIWDDATGKSGDAEYVTNVDGELAICGKLR